MALERLSQITESGIKTGITLSNASVTGVLTAVNELKVGTGVTINSGIVTATGGFVGNLTGNVSATGASTFGGSTFSDNVGIKTTSATKTLDVRGDTQVADLYYTADYPTIRPSLDLVFDKVKRLDSRVTFTRNSTATYVGTDGLIKTAAANEPRFDHDPVTGESLGLLIEEQRTNLFPVSGDVTNVNWTKLAVTSVTDATVTAPDGTLGATKVIQSNTTAQHLVGDTVAGLTLGGYYALSVFVKKGTSTGKIYFSVASFSNWVSDWQFYIDGDTGIVTNLTNVSAANLKVEQYPNGWWRLSMVAQQEPAGGGSGGFGVGFGEPGGSDISNFTGDGSSYFYVWGGQMEAGSFATSYIPTSGSAVTRSADLVSMTGTNFSSWYNQTEGTFFVESAVARGSAYQGYVGTATTSAADGGPSYNFNSIMSDNDNSDVVLNIWNGTGGSQSFISIAHPDGNMKAAGAFKNNDFALSVNGSSASIDPSGTIDENQDQLWIGRRPYTSAGWLNNSIKRVSYYPRRLNNSQLQNITL